MRLGKRFLEVREGIEHTTAFVDFDRPLYEDDMKVLLKDGREVKKISKGLHDFDAGYVGITYVPKQRLKLYKDIAGQLQNENENAVVEVVLQRLVDRNEQLGTVDVSGIRWLEVDNLWDLKNAERILKWVPGYLD